MKETTNTPLLAFSDLSAIRRAAGLADSVPLSGDTHFSGELAMDGSALQQLLLRLEESQGVSLPRDPMPETVGQLQTALRTALGSRRQLSRIVTVPNLLSLFRLLLIPVYVALYLRAETARDFYIAGSVLALSCVTDLFDGWIARHFGQITTLGKMLDPAADKATQFTMILCLATRRPVLWILLSLFLVKELFQLVVGLWYLKRGQMLPGALLPGKISTTVLFVSMILLVLFPSMSPRLARLLVALSALMLSVSFFTYILAYFGKRKKIQTL